MLKIGILILTLCFNSAAFADNIPMHGFTTQQLKAMSKHNKAIAERDFGNPLTSVFNLRGLNPNRRPYAEYEPAGYLFFSDDYFYGMATQMKQAMAKNLPQGVTLVIYTSSQDPDYHQQLITEYTQYVPAERLKIIKVSSAGGSYFWTRDGLPIPVLENIQGTPSLSVVDAKYYHSFEADKTFSDVLGAKLIKHDYYYEGGNFVSNSRGECIVVNRENHPYSHTADIPDDIFYDRYGCKTLTRLPHRKGIGHVDEVLKFISDDVIFTDTPEYKEILDKAGFNYDIRILPQAQEDYETYVNSLIVNNVVFMPIYDEPADELAISYYQNMGFKVITTNSQRLSVEGHGSIHCITMTYPPGPFHRILRDLKAEQIF